MKRHRATRFLSLLLALAMLLSLSALPVLADEEEGTGDSGTVEAEVAEAEAQVTEAEADANLAEEEETGTGEDESGETQESDESDETQEADESSDSQESDDSQAADDADASDGESTGTDDSQTEGTEEDTGDDSGDEDEEIVLTLTSSDDEGIAVASEDGEDGDDSGNETTVAKIGENTYATLAAAVEAASDDETIILTADVDISTTGLTIPTGKSITLDLNGHAIKAANTYAGCIKVSGTLTLEDSSDTSKDGSGGKIYTETAYAGSTTGYALIDVAGTFIMNSGYIYAVIGDDPTNNGQFGVGSAAGGDITINGGKIEAGWYAVSGNGNDTTTYSTITINGGYLISTADYAIYHPQSGELIVNGGTIYGAAGGIYMNRGTLTVTGGTITSKGTGNTGTWGDGTGNSDAAALNVQAKYGAVEATISGGTFIAETNALILTNSSSYTASVSITGGTFSSDVSDYAAEGYAATANSDGTYTVAVDYEAKIGDTTYKTLEAAIAAAKEMSTTEAVTITLLADVETDAVIEWSQATPALTIDLNSHNITKTEDSTSGNTFDVFQGTFTLTGSGTVSNKNGNSALRIKGLDTDTANYTVITVDQNVTLSANYAMFITPYNESGNPHAYGVVVNINGTLGGTICGFYVNGQIADTEGNVPVVNVNSTAKISSTSTSTGDTAAIYAAGYAKYTIANGATITGPTGIEIRAGELTVNGGSITGTATPGSSTGNGNGTTTTGAGIAVVQHTTKLPVIVTINGGEISGYYGVYEGDTEGNGTEAYSSVAVSITDGKITTTDTENGAAVSGTVGTTVISGGTFNTSVADYAASGFAGVTNDDGTFTVAAAKVAQIGSGEDAVTYATLEAAFSAATSGDTITLLTNCTVDTRIDVSTTVTLDLAGCTVSRGACENSALIKVVSGGNLTVKDSSNTESDEGTGKIDADINFTTTSGSTYAGIGLQVSGGSAAIEGGTVYGYYGLYVASSATVTMTGGTATGYIAAYVNSATLTASGGTISAVDIENSGWVYGVYLTGSANVALSASVIVNATPKNNGTYAAGVVIWGSGDESGSNPTLTMTGGTITGVGYGISGNGSSDYTTINISGGTITSTSPGGAGIYHPQTGTLTITGASGAVNISGAMGIQMCDGTLTVGQDSSVENYETYNARITISGTGTNSLSEKTGDGAVCDGAAISVVNRLSSAGYGTPTVTIYGGNFRSTYGDAVSAYTWSSNSDSDWEDVSDYINISGGSYSTVVDPDYCAEGYAPVTTATDGYYTVTVAVAIGYKDGASVANYSSLADAFGATDIDTIELTTAVEIESSDTITAANSVTLDLNGHNLTINSGATLTVDNGAEVTIIDSENTGLVTNNGTINVTSGTLDIRSLNYTDSEEGYGLLGSQSGKISLSANAMFIVPDAWDGMWSNGAWTPNWTSATSGSGIFSSADVGATVYSYGVGWKCTTAFASTSYDSGTTYWEESGTYLVEYYRGWDSGETAWTYPESSVDNQIFAGWYKENTYTTALTCDDTSGIAYAKFVTLCYDDTNHEEGDSTGVLNFLGGSLRMTDFYTEDDPSEVDYSKTSLRFGYDIVIPAGCTDYYWEWACTINGSTGTISGTNYTELEDSEKEAYNASTAFRSNLVVTGIPSNYYNTEIQSELTITYKTADGTTVETTESARIRSVSSVVEAIITTGSGATSEEITYATNIKNYGSTNS